MRPNCVCMQQLESRTLLSAGVPDGSYGDGAGGRQFDQNVVRMQVDGKAIHLKTLSEDHGITSIPSLKRTLANGNVDPTFDTSSAGLRGFIDDFQIDNNGRVIVATQDGVSTVLTRLNPNGTRDNTFGTKGRIALRRPDRIHTSALGMQPDGKILYAGSSSQSGKPSYIYRINPDGSLDKTFGTGGAVAFFAPDDWANVEFSGIAYRSSDKRIVVVGNNTLNYNSSWNVWVLAPSGVVEWRDGQPLYTEPATSGANSVAVDTDGSILVGGWVNDTNVDLHGVLARYPAPHSNAQIEDRDLGQEMIQDMVLQPDGKIIISASTGFETGVVSRFNRSLSQDNSFATSGTRELDFVPASLALQPDGKLIIDGHNYFYGNWQDWQSQSIRLTGDNATAWVSKRTLKVFGTSGNDDIRIAKVGGLIGIFSNAASPFFFSASRIKKLQIDAGAGDDTIHIGKSAASAIIDGGDGSDTLIHKRKKDRVFSIENRR